MNIIVTGGAGFIGSNFVFYMLERHPEDRIICVDSLTYAGNLSTLESVMDNPQFRFVKLDIRDREGIDRLFAEEKPEVVVNFAAESHVDRSIENPGSATLAASPLQSISISSFERRKRIAPNNTVKLSAFMRTPKYTRIPSTTPSIPQNIIAIEITIQISNFVLSGSS